jgi:hypothetical protein
VINLFTLEMLRNGPDLATLVVDPIGKIEDLYLPPRHPILVPKVSPSYN